MDGEMRQAELYMGDVARRCNANLLEKSLVNLDLTSKGKFGQGRFDLCFNVHQQLADVEMQISTNLHTPHSSMFFAAA